MNKGEGFQRTATKYKSRDMQSCRLSQAKHMWNRHEGCAKTFLSDMEGMYRSSLTVPGNNAFDVEKIQATEESMHHGRSSNPPLLISLRG